MVDFCIGYGSWTLLQAAPGKAGYSVVNWAGYDLRVQSVEKSPFNIGCMH